MDKSTRSSVRLLCHVFEALAAVCSPILTVSNRWRLTYRCQKALVFEKGLNQKPSDSSGDGCADCIMWCLLWSIGVDLALALDPTE